MTELEFLLQLSQVVNQIKHLVDQRVEYLKLSFEERVNQNMKSLPKVDDEKTVDIEGEEVETGFAF